jgi:hypothetical protein
MPLSSAASTMVLHANYYFFVIGASTLYYGNGQPVFAFGFKYLCNLGQFVYAHQYYYGSIGFSGGVQVGRNLAIAGGAGNYPKAFAQATVCNRDTCKPGTPIELDIPGIT